MLLGLLRLLLSIRIVHEIALTVGILRTLTIHVLLARLRCVYWLGERGRGCGIRAIVGGSVRTVVKPEIQLKATVIIVVTVGIGVVVAIGIHLYSRSKSLERDLPDMERE
jgi:hypothetical protein